MAVKIWDSKKFARINWQNRPSTTTALGATNLNKIDVFCNDVDNALIQFDAQKLNIEVANSMLASVQYDQSKGQWTFKSLDGATYTFDQNIEKIPVSFSLSETGVLTMVTEDGTEYTANIADLIKDYVFDDSDTVAFSKEFVEEDDEGKGAYHISASVKDGSIGEKHLNPDYRSDILAYKTQAQEAANDALTYSKDSKRWAVGDSEYEGSETDNSKYYKEQAEAAKAAAEKARDEAESLVGVGIATTEKAGIVKPDGTTISIDPDGTIHGPQKFEADGYVYVSGTDTGIEPAPDPGLDADTFGGETPDKFVKKADLYNGFDYTKVGLKAADAAAIKTLKDEQIQLTMTPVDCGSGESAKTFFDNLSSSMPDDTYYRKEIVIQPSAYEDFFAGRYYLEGMKKDSQNEWQKMISYTNSDVSFRKKGSSGWGKWNEWLNESDWTASKNPVYDANNAIEPGKLYLLKGNESSPFPSNSPKSDSSAWYVIKPFFSQDRFLIQKAWSYEHNNEYQRVCRDGVWSDWDSVVTKSQTSSLYGNTIPSSRNANDCNSFGGYYLSNISAISNLPSGISGSAFMMVFGEFYGSGGRFCQLLCSDQGIYIRKFTGSYQQWIKV